MELLIVVAIIAIIGVASFSGFSRLNTTQDMETIAKSVSKTLDRFDQDMIYHRITSYETVFRSGSLGFVTSVDRYRKNIAVVYSFDFATGTGTITTNGSGTGVIQLHLYSADALGDTMQLSESGELQPFSFPRGIERRWYQIDTFMEDRGSLSYEMQYYNLANVTDLTSEEVHLQSILGSDGTHYPGLIVRNILGQKTLLGSGSTLVPLSSATLTFEKNGQETQLTIEH